MKSVILSNIKVEEIIAGEVVEKEIFVLRDFVYPVIKSAPQHCQDITFEEQVLLASILNKLMVCFKTKATSVLLENEEHRIFLKVLKACKMIILEPELTTYISGLAELKDIEVVAADV